MVSVDLRQQRFKEISMRMDINEDKELQLAGSFSYNVDYGDNDKSCVAHLKQKISPSDMSTEFGIAVEIEGLFSCDGVVDEMTKKEAHIQCYAMLFPYVQNMIAQLTMNAGMPPLMIEMERMSIDNIEIVNK